MIEIKFFDMMKVYFIKESNKNLQKNHLLSCAFLDLMLEIIRGNKFIYVVLIGLNNFLIFDGYSDDKGLQRTDRWS